jgi:hypothetical protein
MRPAVGGSWPAAATIDRGPGEDWVGVNKFALHYKLRRWRAQGAVVAAVAQ